MWLLVEDSDDEQEIVFGKLDSQPVVAAGEPCCSLRQRVSDAALIRVTKGRQFSLYD